jgi:hypothetical protein
MPALAGIQGEGGHPSMDSGQAPVRPYGEKPGFPPVFTGMTEGESTWSRGLFSY